nr:hypothetical protein [Tanacetum cinerariifolium]
MAESSSHNSSSPEITPKEQPVTVDKPESLNLFLHADQPRASDGLRRKQSLKHTSESKNEASKFKISQSDKETRFSLAKNKSPSHPSGFTPMVPEMHKEEQQATGGPASLGTTSEERAHPQLSSDSTTKANLRKSAPNDFIPHQKGMDEGTKNYAPGHIFTRTNLSILVDQTKSASDGLKTAHTDLGTNNESKSDEISKKIKLKDLSDLMKDTRSTFCTPDSLQDEPIIVSDESKEDKLEKQKAKAEVEVASLKARASYPDINHLTKLLVTSLKLRLSKLLVSHDFSSYLTTALKELPLKITKLSGDVKEIKKHVRNMEIELPGELKEIPIKRKTFTSNIFSLTS